MRTIPSMSRRSAAAFARLVLLTPALVVCGHSSTSADAAGTVEAVASITQICNYITQFASGDASSDLSFDRTGADDKTRYFGTDATKTKSHLELTCLLTPNASAHEHDMTTAQSKALSEADLFFISGADLRHFLDSAVDSTDLRGTMMVTSGVAGVADIDDLATQKKKEEAKPYKVDRGNAKVEVAKWPLPSEEDESEPEFRFDPHVWTSPKSAIVQVANIGTTLEKATPNQTDVFRSHVDTYIAKLKRPDEWATSPLSSVSQDKRILLTSHDTFDYFNREFGVKFGGTTLFGSNTQQDAMTDKIRQAADEVKSFGAVAIFTKNSSNPKSVQKIVRAAEVRVVIGDEALYGDSLGAPGSDGETYIGSILRNVSSLAKAWNGMVTEIPADLAQRTLRASGVK